MDILKRARDTDSWLLIAADMHEAGYLTPFGQWLMSRPPAVRLSFFLADQLWRATRKWMRTAGL
jgi:hypothetical protein